MAETTAQDEDDRTGDDNTRTQDKEQHAPDPDDARKPDSPNDLTKASWLYVLRKTAREFSADQCTDLAAALTYYATPLTTLKLLANSRIDESIMPGVSGTFTREAGIQLDHSFRRWLIGTLRFAYGHDIYDGSPRVDDRYSVSAGLVYKLTREVHLKGEFRRDWLRSNAPGVDYTANIAMVGLRLQR